MSAPAGYSGKPLAQKLGLKGVSAVVHPPMDYDSLMEAAVPASPATSLAPHGLDFVHAFYREFALFEAELPALKAALKPTGMLWISWPKKAAKVATDLDENLVRDLGLGIGLVDVKIAAIDATWSGLKFVYRLTDR